MEKIKILCFTDPYCSWCWATEPSLYSIREHYGDQVDIQFVMGGLIEDMSKFFDSHNNIGTMAAVVPHWKMVSERSGQPIDENLWVDLEAYPQFSTWPANVAAKAAFIQGKEIGEKFLRKLRVSALTERKIISNEEIYLSLAKEIEGLNYDDFVKDINDGVAQKAFEHDLEICRTYGVTGFPTMVFYIDGKEPTEKNKKAYLLNGHKSTETYEQALTLLVPNIEKRTPKGILDIISTYGPLTTREFSEIYEKSMEEMESELRTIELDAKIISTELRGGTMWKLK